MRLFFENLEALKKYMANEIETYVKAWKSDFYILICASVKKLGTLKKTIKGTTILIFFL